MSPPRARTATLLALLLVSGCAEPPERDGEPPSSPPAAGEPEAPAVEDSPPPQAPPERPATRQDTILIEGMPEPVELRLVRSPGGFPMPFTTYATDDFVVAEPEGTELPTLRLVAAFGGRRNDDAVIEVAAYPAGIAEAEAEETARRLAGEGAEEVPPAEAGRPWAVGEWRIRRRVDGGRELGRLILGRHGEGYFHVLTRYPAEYADGFAPRVGTFLEEWRWGDGSPLGGR